jgi:hypothetical protein
MAHGDRLEQQLKDASQTAAENREMSISAVIHSVLSIRTLARRDLMARLSETAYNFSGLATGRLDEDQAIIEGSKLDLAKELKKVANLATKSGNPEDKFIASALLALVSLHLTNRADLIKEVAAFAAVLGVEATKNLKRPSPPDSP